MTATSLIIGSSVKDRRYLEGKIKGTSAFGHILKEKDVDRAMNAMRNRTVDMIFYGVSDPVHESYGWIHELGIQGGCSDVPVFLFAHTGAEEERIRGLEAGACDFLSFETSEKELAARIRAHLGWKHQIALLKRAKEDLERQATTDGLTGLFNRRFFQRALDTEVARSNRTEQPFSLMLVDVDHFKRINDSFGHPAGDAALKAIAQTLQDSIRRSDTACRFGGEEFALIMPGTSNESAFQVAERIRKRISRLVLPQLPKEAHLTVSIGIRQIPRGDLSDPQQIIAEADEALYAAKRNGRNRTEVFENHENHREEGSWAEGLSIPLAHQA